jgi:hypothetical protein
MTVVNRGVHNTNPFFGVTAGQHLAFENEEPAGKAGSYLNNEIMQSHSNPPPPRPPPEPP